MPRHQDASPRLALRRMKLLLLAPLAVMLLAAQARGEDNSVARRAAAQRVPRLTLDWEPDPNDASIPVLAIVGGRQRIVALRGGMKIRPRHLRAK